MGQSHTRTPSGLANGASECKAKPCSLSCSLFFFVFFLICFPTLSLLQGKETSAKVLDNMSSSSPVVKGAYAFITAHVVLAYPIPLNPMSLALESVLGIDQKKGMAELLPRMASRTCLVLLTVLVASVVPYFGDILSLVSALSIVVVAFILPPIFYYLLHPHKVFSRVEKGNMICIGALGTTASAIGLYYAIDGLIKDIKNNPNPFENYF